MKRRAPAVPAPAPAKDLLFEIGTEEIPARFVPDALRSLEGLAKAAFESAGLAHGALKTVGGPRRLALIVEALAGKSKDTAQEFLGPALAAAKDAQGNWTPAAQGFARSQNTAPEKLEVRKTDKGDRLCAVQRTAGSAAAALLPKLLPDLIRKIPFPKNMVWEESRFSFARPIRWIVALHGADVVKFEIAGVKSGRKTWGLTLVSVKPLDVPNPAKYVSQLRDRCVMADPAERRQSIERQVQQAVKPLRGRVPLENYGALLEEVVHLVEHPVAIVGKFDARYLALPAEVLVTSMKKHQKYFPVFAEQGDALLASFIGIRNGISENQGVVREGYERVLSARLADAAFFFDQDRKSKLADKAESLKSVLFQKELGSVWEKTRRVIALSVALADKLGLDAATKSRIERIGHLGKADLVTAMVGEFPELQGVMGRLYARVDGEDAAVAEGIEQHYWPLSADGALPVSVESAVVSLADKLDTLAGDFLVGLIPSGSQDPYGLRRAAVGVLRILEDKGWRVSLAELVSAALAALPEKPGTDRRKTQGLLLDFFRQRWASLMEAKGHRFDEVQAAAAGHEGFDDPVDTESRLRALSEVRRLPDFGPLAAAFKRAANILKQAAQKNIAIPSEPAAPQLREAQEKALFDRLQQLAGAQKDLAGGQYVEALRSLVSLREPVDAFFGGVMVMDPDEAVRANRLALLSTVVNRFKRVADLSQLQDVPAGQK